MKPPIQRTEEGSWAFTGQVMAVIVGCITVGVFFVTVTAAAVGARQQLASTTPVARHDSLVRAVAENKSAIDTLRGDVLGLVCSQASYPSPFCDRVPRVAQAGKRK